MKRVFILISLVFALTSCSQDTPQRNPDVAPYGHFAEGKTGDVVPKGWIAEFLDRQASGMTGHPEALSYPYNSCLWAGDLDRNTDSYGSDWWRYEQTAYYTDGLLRLGYLLDNEEFITKAREGITYTLDNASEEGELGLSGLQYRWPLAVFFRALQAEYEVTADRKIVDALEKHYMFTINSGENIGVMPEGLNWKWRNIMGIEGILWTYARTGNKALLDYAVAQWNDGSAFELNMEEIMSDNVPYMHGVTYTEEMKLPMLLYAYTGETKYLDAAVRANDKLLTYHMLPDGVPSSIEHLSGNDPRTSHETCDITDYTWSLGYYLMTTGEAIYADAIEKAVFNAGPGAVTKDFKALQYFSSVNQFIATSGSDHNPFKKGSTWMAYRPTHETECCAGNVHRLMPNYVSRMWLEGEREGELVAAMYGPSEIRHELPGGKVVTVTENTAYPFDNQISFVFSMEKSAKFPFTFRVPSWCSYAELRVNGSGYDVVPDDKGFYTLERRYRDGDVLTLILDMPVQVKGWPEGADPHSDEYVGSYVQRGPVLYSYAIPSLWTEDDQVHANMHGKVPENPDFKCWNITPAGPWNYSLAITDEDMPKAVFTESDAYPFDLDNTPYRISVPVVPVDGWELEDGVYTPVLPEEVRLENDCLAIDLVPYGATTLRLTVFPTR